MALPLLSSGPQCMSCIRRMVGSLGGAFSSPAGQQIRGKKKLAKTTTVNVRLLQNILRYGRKGSIIPVTAGLMRNHWLDKKMAEYVTVAKFKELGGRAALVERDTTFGIRQEISLVEDVMEVSTPIPVEVEQPGIDTDLALPTPERGAQLLSVIIPKIISFYRPTISTPHPPSKPLSPSISATATMSAAASKAAESLETQKTGSIYGSVSTADIAANIKALLAEDSEGALVPLSPEDISFVSKTDDKDRVKHLGRFEIVIMIKGSSDAAVRRTIEVKAQQG